MAGRVTVKAIGPSYPLADRKSAVQRAVNLYMRQVEGIGEDKQVVLDSAPGLSLVVTLPATIRGSYNAAGRWFVVAGTKLYEVTTAGAYTERGTLLSSAGYVAMRNSATQLVAVDGDSGYVLELATNVFSTISSDAWQGSDFVDELDGYFIFSNPNSDQFYISANDDADSLNALDFSSADAAPDDVVTFRVLKREVHFFGTRSIEIWINSGDPDFPLARYNSTPIDIGIVGKRAVCIAGDTLVWVGQTERGHGYVYAMSGHQPRRISTQAVEEALNSSTDMGQASMWTYHVEGNEFVGINAPGMATTWVYDFSTQQWHERAELVDGAWVPLRADLVTFVAGDHYCAGGSSLYKVDKSFYLIGSDPLVRERTWPHLMSPSLEPVTFRSLEVACTTGNGGTLTLECSNDGGYVFGAPLLKSLGATGRFMQRIRWHFLGAARDRVFRLRCADAVPLTIHAAAVDAS